MRKLLLSLMLAMALAVGSASTVAASTTTKTYTDTVVGIETAVPTGASPFAGTASGQLPGVWSASVVHGSLPTTQGDHGAITGGTFALLSSRAVSGTFKTGTITLTGGSCTQTFHVEDDLVLVKPSGQGHFDATLTHYGFMFAGHCTIFFATIHGIVTLTF